MGRSDSQHLKHSFDYRDILQIVAAFALLQGWAWGLTFLGMGSLTVATVLIVLGDAGLLIGAWFWASAYVHKHRRKTYSLAALACLLVILAQGVYFWQQTRPAYILFVPILWDDNRVTFDVRTAWKPLTNVDVNFIDNTAGLALHGSPATRAHWTIPEVNPKFIIEPYLWNKPLPNKEDGYDIFTASHEGDIFTEYVQMDQGSNDFTIEVLDSKNKDIFWCEQAAKGKQKQVPTRPDCYLH